MIEAKSKILTVATTIVIERAAKSQFVGNKTRLWSVAIDQFVGNKKRVWPIDIALRGFAWIWQLKRKRFLVLNLLAVFGL
jgi:hypothetical protein